MNFDWVITLPAVLTLASVVVAAGGLYFAWRSARERQMRIDDVLKWSNEVIRTLQTLWLVCSLGERLFEPAAARSMLREIAIQTSVLVEQGRLFFRNAYDPTHGAEKHPAYRGRRPVFLDPLVIAHQIACEFDAADANTRARMTLVAEDAVKEFVSMAQAEVGRSRTMSQLTARGGTGPTLEERMGELAAERLAGLNVAARHSL
jgi:hypothetical protein